MIECMPPRLSLWHEFTITEQSQVEIPVCLAGGGLVFCDADYFWLVKELFRTTKKLRILSQKQRLSVPSVTFFLKENHYKYSAKWS